MILKPIYKNGVLEHTLLLMGTPWNTLPQNEKSCASESLFPARQRIWRCPTSTASGTEALLVLAGPVIHVPKSRSEFGPGKVLITYFYIACFKGKLDEMQSRLDRTLCCSITAELFTQHHVCKGGGWIRLRHASQQPSFWQNHPNTSEGRRQFPRYPLMSLRNQVTSACIQAKNFTTSHVQACHHHCIAFTNKIDLQNTIWDGKLGNKARIANIPMTGTCKKQELTPRLQRRNVALSASVGSASYHTPVTAKKNTV